jgi:phosphoribosyl 1,2-cyclic phosphate phosphodiesterase
MTKDNEEKPGRRGFLKMTTIAAASLAAGGFSGSAYAEEGKAQVKTRAAGNPSVKKVELLFLGTGAADWPGKYPPLKKQLARGQVRGMSSMLVNGHILIDCGPTVLDVMKRYKANPADITDILLTHTHSDHLHPNTLLAIAASRDPKLGPLRFWAHPEALKRAPKSDRIEKRPVVIGETFKVHGFGIIGLESNHRVESSKEKCLIYLIEGAEKSILYATDSSWLLTSTWRHLYKKKNLDALIWDATVGEKKGDYRIFEHNDLAMIRHMNQTLKDRRILKRDAKIILTHMARTLHPSHEQLEKKLLPEGLIPAYDGMSVVLS